MKLALSFLFAVLFTMQASSMPHFLCHTSLSKNPQHPLVTVFQKIENSGIDIDDLTFKVDVQFMGSVDQNDSGAYDFESDHMNFGPSQISAELQIGGKGHLIFELDEIENGFARGAIFETGGDFKKGSGLGTLLYLFVATFIYTEYELLLQSDTGRSVSDSALAVWDRFVSQGLATAGLGRSRTFNVSALETPEFRRLNAWFAQRRTSNSHYRDSEESLQMPAWLIDQFTETLEWQQIFEINN